MAGKKKSRYRGHALPAEVVAERAAHAGSGASGVHADQSTRRKGTVRTNRVGSRSSLRRAVIADDDRA